MDQSIVPTNAGANLDVLGRVGELVRSGYADRDNHPFADDFVFHFFNAQLSDLNGDYHAIDGVTELFERFGERSEHCFRQLHHL